MRPRNPLRVFRRASVEEEVETELAFHLEMSIHDLMEQGMTRSQARAEAERRFGDRTAVDTECLRYGTERDRNERRAELRDELRQDVGFAVRQLAKARGFTIVAVLTLALGIGATAAVFSVLDAVVLRPLPFPHPEQIVVAHPMRAGEVTSPSVPEYLGLRGVNELRSVAAAILGSGATLHLGDTPEMVNSGRVTADFFNVFGIQPMLGRAFTPDEDTPGNPNVVVLGHRFWVSHFNSDRSVVGRVVSIDGVPHTILGVMPASFDIKKGSEDLWLPLALTPAQATSFGEHYLNVYARLRGGTTLAQAEAAATAAERAVAERIPDRTSPVSVFSMSFGSYASEFVGDYRSRLAILLGAVGFVLFIACGNVANLLLARGTTRARELAVRAALGAGRGRLVRQLLTESVVLSLAGAAAGLAVAYGLVRLILAVSPDDVPRLDQAGVDWRVLLFTLALGVMSSLIFGLLPALRASGPRLQGALREGGRGSASTRDRARGVLVAAEVALAITLLVGSGLLIRSAILMQRVEPGFDARGVLTSRLVLPAARYQTGESIVRAYRQIRDAAAQIPGVASAALTTVVPLSGSSMNASVRAENQPKGDHPPQADLRQVSSGYFTTVGIPLITGRDVNDRDDIDGPPVVVISEALARQLWLGADPRDAIGRRLETLPPSHGDYWEVVGVVGNVHDASLAKAAGSTLYIPYQQTPNSFWSLSQRSLVVVLRARNASLGGAQALVEPLRRAVASVDPSLPLADKQPLEKYVHDSMRTARMNTILLSTLGGIALVLAMVGVYGVVSYFVSQRTQEIGLRIALGATPVAVWQFVVNRGLRPIVVGLAFGVVLSLATTNVLRGQLFGVTPRDPLTIAAVGLLLLAIAIVAMYVPARRAMRVPPLVALNEG